MSSIQRRIALAIGAVLAVMAFVVPSAMAATEVKDAKTGKACSAVSPALNPKTPEEELKLLWPSPPKYSSGGCTVHMSYVFKNELIPPGASLVTNMVYGGTWLYEECRITYDIHVGPTGWGYANNFAFSSPGICGSHGPWKEASGTIAPRESNPYGIFKSMDANTDLNGVFKAMSGGQEGYGSVSLDVTHSEPLVLDNQFDVGDPIFLGNGSFRDGVWEGNAGLIVTH